MVAHGYTVFLIRAARPNRPRALLKLSSIATEAERVDLLESLERELRKIGSRYRTDEHSAEGYRFRVNERHGRELFLGVNKGPEGALGETYNRQSGRSRDTDENISLLSRLHASFFIPEDSYFGFLFVERSGVRNLKDLLNRLLIQPLSLQLRIHIRLEGYAEADDWRRELAGQTVLRISEVLVEDGSEDTSVPQDTIVKVTTEGTRVQRVSEEIKSLVVERITNFAARLQLGAQLAPLEDLRRVPVSEPKPGGPRTKRSPRAIFTVGDEAEYDRLADALEALDAEASIQTVRDTLANISPMQHPGYSSKGFHVATGTAKPEKTFVVEGDSVPQFVYPTGDRLTDTQFRNTWESHVGRLLKHLDVAVPDTWLDNVEVKLAAGDGSA